MNSTKHIATGILLDSYQYAPVYLVQDPASIQAVGTYMITSTNDEHGSPGSNLKSFYENSNNIECDMFNTPGTNIPVVLPQSDNGPVGNQLKLASFLLPKTDDANKVQIMSNVKANFTPSNHNNSASKIVANLERNIVKIKGVPILKTHSNEITKMPQPKTKSKQKEPPPIQSKYTSVQLIKLGETYHSVNQLSEEQMKMVNKALKMLKEPRRAAPAPAYDPATNTKYIYKIVSPKDLAVVGKKKVVTKDGSRNVSKSVKKVDDKPQPPPPPPAPRDDRPPAQTKVTRSGRRVRLPRPLAPEGARQRARRKHETVVTCCQCSADFGSLYRLQKHYEQHPTHVPARAHCDLFHCLLAIVRGGGGGARVLLQQLEQLLAKLRALLPCLLSRRGRPCTIGADVGRLFGVSPGTYGIDVDALTCVKDPRGACEHRPAPAEPPRARAPDCARVSSVAEWPTVGERNWRLKRDARPAGAKRMRLPSGGEPAPSTASGGEPAPSTASGGEPAPGTASGGEPAPGTASGGDPAPGTTGVDDPAPTPPVGDGVRFRSAHFDIRSSPIKPSSAVFRTFQINPSKLGTFEARAVRSLAAVESPDIDPEIKQWIVGADEAPRAGLLPPGDSVLTFLDALDDPPCGGGDEGGGGGGVGAADFQLDLFA